MRRGFWRKLRAEIVRRERAERGRLAVVVSYRWYVRIEAIREDGKP